MYKIRQVFAIVHYNFRGWHKNYRVLITFCFAFILSFLLASKVLDFADRTGYTMEIFETFIWTFGDGTSILLSSALLMLLFADMPFITSGTPFFLMRTTRRTWIIGQAVYIVTATSVFLLFILGSTAALCMGNSFLGNQWSDTAAALGYSGVGEKIAVPALVKTLELSRPYESMFSIFLLMLLYTLLMVFIMLAFQIKKGALWGNISVIVFSLGGLLLKPELLVQIFHIPERLIYQANIMVGWLSPLNHATYYMHNFGYDELPRINDSYLIFIVAILFFFFLSVRFMKKYNFNFTGTEE